MSCEATKQCFQNTIVDNPRLMRGAIPRAPNLHFATVSCNRPTESYERVHPAKSKCASHYNGAIQNFKMHVSLQRRAPKCMNPAHDARGNLRHTKTTILPQFRTSGQHEVTRGLRGRSQNLHFTTVLDVRRARSDERDMCKIRISPQFWASGEHEVTRGLRGTCAKFAFHHSIGRPTTRK